VCRITLTIQCASFRQSALSLFGEFRGGAPRAPPLNAPLTVMEMWCLKCWTDARTDGRSGDFMLCPVLCIALDRQRVNTVIGWIHCGTKSDPYNSPIFVWCA